MKRTWLMEVIEKRHHGRSIVELLDELYWEQGWSAREIAEDRRWDCHPSTIAAWLRASELSLRQMAAYGHQARKAADFKPHLLDQEAN